MNLRNTFKGYTTCEDRITQIINSIDLLVILSGVFLDIIQYTVKHGYDNNVGKSSVTTSNTEALCKRFVLVHSTITGF